MDLGNRTGQVGGPKVPSEVCDHMFKATSAASVAVCFSSSRTFVMKFSSQECICFKKSSFSSQHFLCVSGTCTGASTKRKH